MRRLAAFAVVLTGLAAGAQAAAAAPTTRTFGHSVKGVPLRVTTVGDTRAPRTVLVIGCIHGDEGAGIAITRALRAATAPDGVRYLIVTSINPDGRARGTRGNARGVDLNRNYPRGWRPLDGLYESGPRPSSEPETRALERLVLTTRPDVTIWFHQHMNVVDLQTGSDQRLIRRYARVVGMRTTRIAYLPGTATQWENHRLPGSSAFVVELPAGSLRAGAVARHLGAIDAVARSG